MATYPNAVVRFHASDMILCADTDDSYMTEPEARSCSEGQFLVGSIASKYEQERLNGQILVICKKLKISASAAE